MIVLSVNCTDHLKIGVTFLSSSVPEDIYSYNGENPFQSGLLDFGCHHKIGNKLAKGRGDDRAKEHEHNLAQTPGDSGR